MNDIFLLAADIGMGLLFLLVPERLVRAFYRFQEAQYVLLNISWRPTERVIKLSALAVRIGGAAFVLIFTFKILGWLE